MLFPVCIVFFIVASYVVVALPQTLPRVTRFYLTKVVYVGASAGVTVTAHMRFWGFVRR